MNRGDVFLIENTASKASPPGDLRRRRRREPRGTPCTCFAAARARTGPSRRTPCTCFAASRARRRPSRRTPCSCSAAAVLADARAAALLHRLRCLPCAQKLEGRHSLHLGRCLPCSADLRAPALLALASPPPVLADARAPALLALSLPPVLADARAPRTPCTGVAASRARRSSSPALLALFRCLPCSQKLEPPHLALRTPVLAEARAPALAQVRCSRAHRPEPRTPCTGFAASRARTGASPRTPCTCFAASRARRSSSPRTPCSCVAASRARRSPSPGTPCSSTLLGPCRARTPDPSPRPRPRADAFRGPRPWRNARWVVTRDPVAAPPGTPSTLNRCERDPKPVT